MLHAGDTSMTKTLLPCGSLSLEGRGTNTCTNYGIIISMISIVKINYEVLVGCVTVSSDFICSVTGSFLEEETTELER